MELSSRGAGDNNDNVGNNDETTVPMTARVLSTSMTVNVSLCGAVPRSSFDVSASGRPRTCRREIPNPSNADRNSHHLTANSCLSARTNGTGNCTAVGSTNGLAAGSRGAPKERVSPREISRAPAETRAPAQTTTERVASSSLGTTTSSGEQQEGAATTDLRRSSTSEAAAGLIGTAASSTATTTSAEAKPSASQAASASAASAGTTTIEEVTTRCAGGGPKPTSAAPAPFQLHPRLSGSGSGGGRGLHLDLSCLGSSASSSRPSIRRASSSTRTAPPPPPPPPLHRPSSTDSDESGATSGAASGSGNEAGGSQRPTVEPPPWAVAARGEARLEPVCESIDVQTSVDLTARPYYRVGRSPNSDVQLLHNTSSRRHALLFHHPNGSCYVVDCGSAHGTYVNGVRVKSAVVHPSLMQLQQQQQQQQGSSSTTTGSGMVVPHRVRRGALIRFGGPGAPSFVLKSFSVGFDALVKELGSSVGTQNEDVNSTKEDDSAEDMDSVSTCPTKAPLVQEVARRLNQKENVRNSEQQKLGKEGKAVAAAITDRAPEQVTTESAAAKLVQLNTRLNAIGGMASASLKLDPRGRYLLLEAVQRHKKALFQGRESTTSTTVNKKRSRDSALSALTTHHHRDAKKIKSNSNSSSSSPLTLVTVPQSPNPALVSPVTVRPVFTSPTQQHRNGQHKLLVGGKLLLSPPPLTLTETPLVPNLAGMTSSTATDVHKQQRQQQQQANRKRVRFSDAGPQLFFPMAVTPDELSSDESGGDYEEEESSSASASATSASTPSSSTLPLAPTTPRIMVTPSAASC